eukprot:scaffold25383_cov36-Phaeocystis_antarctica.AAC.1
MSGHHPATVRRAGRKRGARFESSEMTPFFEGRRKAADRNSPLERTCSAALARASFISDFLTTMSASAARTRSSHTRWGNE